MELIVATSMLGYPELVSALGGDPDAMLAPLGLRTQDCGSPDVVIPLRNAILAAEKTATELGVPDFGRRLAALQGIEILGPVGVAAGTAASVGSALVIFEKFMAAYSPAIAVRVRPGTNPDSAFWEWRAVLNPPVQHQQTVELSLGIMLRILRLFLGAAYRPVSVNITHRPLTPASAYHEYFGCPATFDAPAAGFELSARDLDRPLSDDPNTHRAAMEQLVGVIGSGADSAATSVARLSAALLPSGTVSLELIAGQFSMHPKALQRRLAAEGTSFSELIDKIRRDAAGRLLRDTDIGLIHLTHQLGYADQAVLTRACLRWFGRTPSAYRSEARLGAAGGSTQVHQPALAT